MSSKEMNDIVLVVEDEAVLRMALSQLLNSKGFDTLVAGSIAEARELLKSTKATIKAAIVDFHLSDGIGPEIIADICQKDQRIMVIAFSGDKEAESFNQSLDSGALVFLSKDMDPNRLIEIVRRMVREYNERYASSEFTSEASVAEIGAIGVSKHLKEAAGLVKKYAAANLPVLIRGENGTGKDVMAAAIHRLSDRSKKPFFAVNCAALSKDLIASELFGHKKGSFTGANSDKIGAFQAAEGGTLFLDEIGDMPADMQTALLRVLQNSEFSPVGSTQVLKTNVRIVAATNAKLEESIKQGQFRMDLFYRLNALPLRLQPLRNRKEDIQPLVQSFVDNWNREAGQNRSVHAEVFKAMSLMDWPGNVRQLKHLVGLLLVISEGQIISKSDFDNALAMDSSDSIVDQVPGESLVDYQVWLSRSREAEIAIIKNAIQSANGNQTIAAEILGLSRSHYRSRLKVLGIDIDTK